MMREIGHFVGGKAVKGCSGRFGDVFVLRSIWEDLNLGSIFDDLAKPRDLLVASGAEHDPQDDLER